MADATSGSFLEIGIRFPGRSGFERVLIPGDLSEGSLVTLLWRSASALGCVDLSSSMDFSIQANVRKHSPLWIPVTYSAFEWVVDRYSADGVSVYFTMVLGVGGIKGAAQAQKRAGMVSHDAPTAHSGLSYATPAASSGLSYATPAASSGMSYDTPAASSGMSYDTPAAGSGPHPLPPPPLPTVEEEVSTASAAKKRKMVETAVSFSKPIVETIIFPGTDAKSLIDGKASTGGGGGGGGGGDGGGGGGADGGYGYKYNAWLTPTVQAPFPPLPPPVPVPVSVPAPVQPHPAPEPVAVPTPVQQQPHPEPEVMRRFLPTPPSKAQ